MADLGLIDTIGGCPPKRVRVTRATQTAYTGLVQAFESVVNPTGVSHVGRADIAIYRPFAGKHTAYWNRHNSMLHMTMCTGILSGRVYQDGFPLENALVRVFHRPSGYCVGACRTNSSGSWSVGYLESTDINNYFAVSFDDNDGYNAVVMDKLTPA